MHANLQNTFHKAYIIYIYVSLFVHVERLKAEHEQDFCLCLKLDFGEYASSKHLKGRIGSLSICPWVTIL